jgi:hypothetical protein
MTGLHYTETLYFTISADGTELGLSEYHIRPLISICDKNFAVVTMVSLLKTVCAMSRENQSKIVPVHNMKAYRWSNGTAPLINLLKPSGIFTYHQV